MAKDKDSLVGSSFAGRFRIEALLGKGGMGRVYLARHTVLDRLFAIKVIQKELITDLNVAARFRREARAASRVQHPNITAVVDFGHTDDGRPYLVMEHVEGPTLASVIAAEGALPVTRCLRILGQMADALAAAHACQVIHRDLKPHNIVLTRQPGRSELVKILDFGLAKIVGVGATGLTHDGETLGTPDYMSPEQCAGRRVDLRTDIYSFGVMAYEMLVGAPPFSGTIVQKATAHLRQPAAAPSSKRPGLSESIDRLILRCLSKSRRQRFQSAGELAEEIYRLRAEHGDPAKRRRLAVYYDEQTGSISYTEYAAGRDTIESLDGWDDESTAEWSKRAGDRHHQPSLDEIACAIRDRGLGSSRISAVLANKVAAEDLVFEIQSKIATLEATRAEIETSARQREARLRQALAQLEHERSELTAALTGTTLPLTDAKATTEVDVRAAQLEENALGIAGTIRSLSEQTQDRLAGLQHQMEEQRQRLASAQKEAERHHAALAKLVRAVLHKAGDQLRDLLPEKK